MSSTAEVQVIQLKEELYQSQGSSQAALDIAVGRCNAKDQEIAKLKADLARVEQNHKDLMIKYLESVTIWVE